ncbi:acyltransferase family protein [Phenylobacterium sp.]|uniref:acyltransferase family protein n=1 Tax=Phenylobacterium sp. TaxID=1871053 RepID=UPI002737BFCF|nr:acyltransferase family protein [Phenylobacterium sp.]MDP3869974.1 acyltransferase family protein [Phenylobacterium sp.]
MTEVSDRLHALDAVRGFALLAGVVFHASMSFLPGTAPLWIVGDVERSASLGVLSYVLHVFRMTAFFLIAGFFGRMMLHRKGGGGFVRDRLKRIALPLVVFWPILIVGVVGAAWWGAVVMAKGAPLPPPPKAPPGMIAPFPLTHLWFLYLLMIFYAAMLPARGIALADRSGRLAALTDRTVSFLIGNPFAPVLLATPLAAALYFQTPWLMWFGIPTPDMSLVPNTPAFVGYGVAFAFGWLVQRQADLVQAWGRRWTLNLVLALGFTATALAIAGLAPSFETPPQGQRKLLYAAVYSLAVWTWTLAVIGLAIRFLSGESRARRYIADASYWLYLIHLPIVMALQVAVSQVAAPWPLKFAAILAAAFAIMFASYHLLVRRTWLGGWLNGKRHPRPSRIPANSGPPVEEPAR